MSHKVTKYDVITDLKRCLYASYSNELFEDENVKVFLKKAEENLEKIGPQLKKEIYDLVRERITKSKNANNLIDKRREDLLTASCLLV